MICRSNARTSSLHQRKPIRRKLGQAHLVCPVGAGEFVDENNLIAHPLRVDVAQRTGGVGD